MKATNFDLRITKEQAECLLELSKTKTLPLEIMCKECGDDDEWVGLSFEDLDEAGHLDEDYQTFEVWL